VATLWPLAAQAHPIEPLVTGAPMPIPRDWVALDAGYGALHAGTATDQQVPLSIAAGIGGWAEIGASTAIDATGGAMGPVRVGGKVLLTMEDARSLDLALAIAFGSNESVRGALLGGRSIAPGFYLQASASVEGSGDASSPSAPARGLLRRARPLHAVDGVAQPPGTSLIVAGAAALEWAPRPCVLPTFELQLARAFADAGDVTSVLLVPELIYLLQINHLSIKLALPVGVAGPADIGLLAQLDWQR